MPAQGTDLNFDEQNEQVQAAIAAFGGAIENFKSFKDKTPLKVKADTTEVQTEPTAEGVPTLSLKERLGNVWGKIKEHLEAKLPIALQILLNKMKAVMLNPRTGSTEEKISQALCEKMDATNALKNRLDDFVGGIANKTNALVGAALKLLKVILRLARIIQLILALPLPTSVPPGIGVPMSVINTINDIKDKVGRIVNLVVQLANAMIMLAIAIQGYLGPATSILNKIKEIVAFAEAYCLVLAGRDPTDPNLELDDALNQAEQDLEDALNLIQAQLDGLGDEGWDDILNNLADTFIEMDVDDILPEGIKSRLRRRRIQGEIGPGDNTDVQGGDGTDQDLGPDGLPLGAGDPNAFNNRFPNSELFTAIDGNVYLLMAKDDPKSNNLVALRRFGTAQLWNNGDPSAVVLTSPVTFTTDVRIILDDIKIRLNTQLTIL